MFLLVAHFQDGAAGGPDREAALDLLVGAPQTRRLTFARSTDDESRWVLVAEFDTAADYRRVLSPFEARTVLVPWLSTADVASSGISEVVLAAADGTVTRPVPTVIPPAR